jgi:AcrR family transcriptional regulator
MMGRHEIAGAEEKILLATIEVAGNETRGTFSTKEVALRAGVSEFTVFSHFHDKETLLLAVEDKLYNEFYEEELRQAERFQSDSEGLFNALIDYFLARPSILRFVGNYSPIFPREEELGSYEAFMARLEQKKPIVRFSSSFVPTPYDGSLILYALREIVSDGLYLLSGISDTRPTRHAMYVLFAQGANAFVKVAD